MVLDCVRDPRSGIVYKYRNYDQFDFMTEWQMLGIQDYSFSLQLRVISSLLDLYFPFYSDIDL